MRKLLVPLLLLACSKSKPAATAPGELPSNGDGAGRLAATSSKVTVTCEFADGWAAVVPKSAYREDEYTMQALIGFNDDPAFWGGEAGYRDLAPYAARPCSGEGAAFDTDGAGALLLIGKANTFNGDAYGINGVIVDLDEAGTRSFRFGDGDLSMTWPCISCPHVYVWTGGAWELRGEVLRDVVGAGAETTQRRSLGRVRVEDGAARLRLAEEEDETSHVDALLLEIGGVVVAPAATGLDAIDGARRTLQRGDVVELSYTVALPDGDYDADALATGYYVPLDGVR